MCQLLEENDDGDQSEFMETIRDQYLQEVFEFPVVIEKALHSADIDKCGFLSAGQICAILREIDPQKPAHEVQEYMVSRHQFCAVHM
jgi:hypothetical protein